MITPEAQGKMEAAQACAHVRNLSRKAWARREHSPLIVPHEWPSATPACARKPQNQRAGDRTASPPHHPDSGTTPTSPLLGLVPYFLSQGRMFLQGREQTASVRRAGQHSRGGGGGAASGDRCGGRCSASLLLAEARKAAPCFVKGSGGHFWKRRFKVCSGLLLQLRINNTS